MNAIITALNTSPLLLLVIILNCLFFFCRRFRVWFCTIVFVSRSLARCSRVRALDDVGSAHGFCARAHKREHVTHTIRRRQYATNKKCARTSNTSAGVVAKLRMPDWSMLTMLSMMIMAPSCWRRRRRRRRCCGRCRDDDAAPRELRRFDGNGRASHNVCAVSFGAALGPRCGCV